MDTDQTAGTPRAPRLLVTGSRDWADHATLTTALHRAWIDLGRHPGTVLVTGACPTGADAHAETCWAAHALPIERHPAQWGRHGRGAGPLRNQAMVDLGADLCLAFIRNHSRGATGCADLAERAGIPTRRHHQHCPHAPAATHTRTGAHR